MTTARRSPALSLGAAGGRRGMALSVIVCIILVVAAFFLVSSFLTRTQQQTARYYFDTENALNLAESTAQELVWALRTLTHPGSDRPDLQALFDQLLGVPAGREAAVLDLRPGPAIEPLLADLGSISPLRITAQAFLSGFKPLALPPAALGLRPDPREKEGLLKLQITVHCGEAIRVLNVLHRVKVMRITHPVLSRFTLFVKEAPTTGAWTATMNPLHQDDQSLNADPDAYFLADHRQPASPIVLDHGRTIDLAPGGSFDFAGNAEAGKAIAADNAPVFFGGKWRVGLAEGNDRSATSERFLVRLAKYDLMEDIQEMSLEATKRTLLNPPPRSSIHAAWLQTFGVNDDWRMGGAPIPLEQTQAYQFYKHPDPEHPTRIDQMKGSFAFRLFGTLDRFSPTLVLGDVERYYQRLVSIDCDFRGFRFLAVTLPFLDEEWFSRLKAPASLDRFGLDPLTITTLQGVATVFGIRPGHDDDLGFAWEYYRDRFRCMLLPEHVLRGLDFVFTNRETGQRGRPVTQNNGTSPMPANGEVYSRLPWRQLDLPPPPASGRGVERPFLGRQVTVRHREGEPLFQGDLNDVDGLHDMIVRGARRFATTEAFLERCRLPSLRPGVCRLALPGAVIVTPAPGPALRFPGPVRVERGGVLVVMGDVLLNAPIETAPGELLTIVASGKVTIATAGPLAVSLIAAGGLTKDPALPGFSIDGPVAAARLDFAPLVAGAGPKRIAYAPIFDERRPRPDEPHFPRRLVLSDEFRQFFSKALP